MDKNKMKAIVKVDSPVFELDGQLIILPTYRRDFPSLEELVDGEILYWYSEDRWYIHNHNRKKQTEGSAKFKVGDKAYKPKGYKFPCTIVSVFKTVKGEVRVVAEMDDYGLLHIFNEQQLEHYQDQYQEIIEMAYQNYVTTVKNSIDLATREGILKPGGPDDYNYLSKDSFVHRIKSDKGFSKDWGLKIVERDLDLEERRKLVTLEMHREIYNAGDPSTLSHPEIDQWSVPTKVVTVTHKDLTIEVYE
jgi:hypothetical protein